MIDEDLYQQATDELNSDKRRPHIWARACALASDDHDEARYLYTNLRVEELIAEREAYELGNTRGSSDSTNDQQDGTLTLEPLDSDEEIPESISAPSGVDQTRGSDESLTLDSMSAESDEVIETIERTSFEEKFEHSEELGNLKEQDEPTFSEEYLDETINLTSELDGTAVFELETSDASEFDNDDLALENTEIMSGAEVEELDELEALLGGVYHGSAPPPPTDPLADNNTDHVMTLDFSDVTGRQNDLDDGLDDHLDELLDDSLEWKEGELTPEEYSREVQKYASQTSKKESLNDTGRLAQELARQADDLPGQRNDIVAVNSDTEKKDSSVLSDEERKLVSGDTFDEEAERDVEETLRQKIASESVDDLDDDDTSENLPHHDHDEQLPARNTGETSTPNLSAAAAMAAAGVAAASHSTPTSGRKLPVDLSDQQSGTRYTVFRRGDQAQAVKSGVSWPALFLTLPYLVYRHLFGTALVYGAMWMIVLAGLLVSGLAWLDAGSLASTIVKYSTVGFALLALTGLLYLPFRYANQWREEKLEQRGFELVAWVRASSPGKAISEARRAATLD